MESEFYAHSREGKPPEEWQKLEDHLHAVAEKARDFASVFHSGDWAYLAGLWHDLGKYSDDFQKYLRFQNGFEAHIENAPGRVDHSTAGARHAAEQIKIMGHLLAYDLAGHHSGLLDGRAIGACQEDRLKKVSPSVVDVPRKILQHDAPALPEFLKWALGRHDAFAISFFTRMIFSCLVDADFLDTEKFMQPDKALLRVGLPEDTLVRMGHTLDEYMQDFAVGNAPVNVDRAAVREACSKKLNDLRAFFR